MAGIHEEVAQTQNHQDAYLTNLTGKEQSGCGDQRVLPARKVEVMEIPHVLQEKEQWR